MKLIHFWFCPASDRARLALAYKGIAHELIVPDYDEDELFFELGIARTAPVVLWPDGGLETDSITLFAELDRRHAQPSLLGPLSATQWQAVLDWRTRATQVLDRLHAPVKAAYRGIGDDDGHLAAYKASVAARWGMSVEELANDRYGAFAELDQLTHLRELGGFLRVHRFYAGTLSAADILMTADLFPLQLLDGVTLPIDLMYYFERVQEACGVDLRAGLLAG
ncbi:MAG: glutathione S-transferase N-terminal domain-containing protein [Gammaproteobacteria bacterium]|nr:glutathione S-transferase N-terminal domain-containing protein [Gammaproteobacteria bacterium]